MSTKLDRLSELAKEDPKRRFFSIAHLITPEALNAAFRGLRKDASAGVDGVTHEEYQKDAERNIRRLHQRLKDRGNRHAPVGEQQKTLNAKLRGHYQYYGRPTNSQCLGQFYWGTCKLWYKWLN